MRTGGTEPRGEPLRILRGKGTRLTNSLTDSLANLRTTERQCSSLCNTRQDGCPTYCGEAFARNALVRDFSPLPYSPALAILGHAANSWQQWRVLASMIARSKRDAPCKRVAARRLTGRCRNGKNSTQLKWQRRTWFPKAITRCAVGAILLSATRSARSISGSVLCDRSSRGRSNGRIEITLARFVRSACCQLPTANGRTYPWAVVSKIEAMVPATAPEPQKPSADPKQPRW